MEQCKKVVFFCNLVQSFKEKPTFLNYIFIFQPEAIRFALKRTHHPQKQQHRFCFSLER